MAECQQQTPTVPFGSLSRTQKRDQILSENLGTQVVVTMDPENVDTLMEDAGESEMEE